MTIRVLASCDLACGVCIGRCLFGSRLVRMHASWHETTNCVAQWGVRLCVGRLGDGGPFGWRKMKGCSNVPRCWIVRGSCAKRCVCVMIQVDVLSLVFHLQYFHLFTFTLLSFCITCIMPFTLHGFMQLNLACGLFSIFHLTFEIISAQILSFNYQNPDRSFWHVILRCLASSPGSLDNTCGRIRHVSGPKVGLAGWHCKFSPQCRAGLMPIVLSNRGYPYLRLILEETC